MWKHRLMLESLHHLGNAFVTLTYAEDRLPEDMSLDPVTLELWLKRFRQKISPLRIRYFAVGEYGEKSMRPHYHVLLFGYPTCLKGRSVYRRSSESCCTNCDIVRETWGFGNVMLGTVTLESCGYVCEYVTKNMLDSRDDRLHGREPEFKRQSLKPGIGFAALDELSQALLAIDADESEDDVPLALRHGAYVKPLGRYLRTKLRGMIKGDEKAPEFYDEEMLDMWLRAKLAAPSQAEVRNNVFKNLIIEAGEQRVLNMKAKAKLRKGRTL